MSRIPENLNGKKVVDAKYGMSVTVEPDDIRKGNKKQPHACAVARACIRSLDANSAHISRSRAYVEFDKRVVRYNVPPALRNEIVAFDQGGKFTPDTYVLMPPSHSQKLGSPQKRNASPKKRNKPHRPADVRSISTILKHMRSDNG